MTGDKDFNDFINGSEETAGIVFSTETERLAEMAELNDEEQLYSCMPPQQTDIVSIIEASNIASLR